MSYREGQALPNPPAGAPTTPRWLPRQVMVFEEFIRYTGLAVGLMVFEEFISYASLAVGLKPSATGGEARLRGLCRSIIQRHVSNARDRLPRHGTTGEVARGECHRCRISLVGSPAADGAEC